MKDEQLCQQIFSKAVFIFIGGYSSIVIRLLKKNYKNTLYQFSEQDFDR